jgi:hypothetical protein
MKHLLMAALAALSFHLAAAVEVAGVKFDDKTRVGTGELVVNGAGLRKKAVFKVYAMALYLPEKSGDAEAVLAARGASGFRSAAARPLGAAVRRSPAGRRRQQPFGSRDGGPQGSPEAVLRYPAGRGRSPRPAPASSSTGCRRAGTRLTVNGQVKGKDIAGEDFYKALLKIWLGNKPVQDDLKQALLGKAS